MLSNSTDIPLLITDDSNEAYIEHLVTPKAEKIYYFETKSKDNFVRIRQDVDPGVYVKDAWSPKFSLDNIDDFIVSIRVQPEEVKGEVQEDGSGQWYLPTQENGYTRYVRVIVTTKDNSTLFVLFSDPPYPDIMISNTSDMSIFYKQKGSKNFDELVPNSSTPFVFEDLISDKNKEITIKFDDKTNNYKLDEIKQFGKVKAKSGTFEVALKAQKDYKELSISNPQKQKEVEVDPKGNVYKLLLMNKMLLKCFLITLNVKSICVSMIDSDPKEVLLVSLVNPLVKFGKRVSFHSVEIDQNLDLIVDHVQIDNMGTMQNPVIFCPKKLLNNEEVKKEDNEEYTPFFQAKIEKHITKYRKTKSVKYPCIMLAVQEMV